MKKLLQDRKTLYLILVIISIGAMLLQQLITSKQQKTQMELQSVDGMNGQAAQTSKMMMWMMPIMMAVFSFIYTSAFSIYIIISSLISVLTTFGINYLADKKFKNTDNKENKNN